MGIEQWIVAVPPANHPYWGRVRWVAKEMGSDGCTGVADWHLDACYEHDLHWRTGLTLDFKPITTAQANRRFRLVIQSRSWCGRLSPLSWLRWIGVTVASPFIRHKSK